MLLLSQIVLAFNAVVLIFTNVTCLEEKTYDKSIYISGNLEHYPYEKFTKMQHVNKSTLESFTLRRVEFNPADLLTELESCPALTDITILNVVWTGKFSRKVNFPHLSRIELRRSKWLFSTSSVTDFLDMIFFESMENSTELSKRTIIVGEEKQKNFVYYFNILHVTEIPYDVQQFFPYTQLEAEKTVIDVSKFNGSQLKKLEIKDSRLVSGTGNDLLTKLKDITELRLRQVKGQHGIPSFDLSLMNTNSLETLVIEDAQRVYSSNLTSQLTFTKLRNLQIARTEFNPTGINFSDNSITEIRIEGTSFGNSGFDFLDPMTALQTVELTPEAAGNSKKQFDLSLLMNSRASISSLVLARLNITLNRHFQFRHLYYLSLENCYLDPNLLNNLSFVFNKTDSIHLENQINDGILTQFLKTTMKRFMIQGIKLIGADNVKVKKFLKDANSSKLQDSVTLSNWDGGIWKYQGVPDDERKHTEVTLFYVYLCILMTLCALGTFGNALSIVVLSKKSMMSSTSCILIALGVFDLIILLTAIGSLPLYAFKLVSLFLDYYKFPFGPFDRSSHISLLGEDPIGRVTFFEQLQSSYIYPLSKTAHSGSVYITVLATLERFVAVCHPLKVKFWTSKRKAFGLSIVILMTAIVVNLPRWWETTGSTIEVTTQRYKMHTLRLVLVRNYHAPNILQERFYRVFYHGYFWAILMYLIPIPVLTFLNTKIWMQIKASVQRRRNLSTSHSENDMTALTVMLLCVSTCFVLTNVINGVIIWIFVSTGSYDPRDIEVFSSIPVIVNSSTNFIFYSILGKKFRRELISLLRTCPGFSHCLKNQSEVTTTSDFRLTSIRSRV